MANLDKIQNNEKLFYFSLTILAFVLPTPGVFISRTGFNSVFPLLDPCPCPPCRSGYRRSPVMRTRIQNTVFDKYFFDSASDDLFSCRLLCRSCLESTVRELPAFSAEYFCSAAVGATEGAAFTPARIGGKEVRKEWWRLTCAMCASVSAFKQVLTAEYL